MLWRARLSPKEPGATKPSAVSRAEKSKARDSGHQRTKRPLARALPGASASGTKRRGPPRATRPNSQAGTSKGGAAARSTGTPRKTTHHEPRKASASLLTTHAREHRGAGVKRAQTNKEALRPEAARPNTTARAAKRTADETRPTGSARSDEAAQTNATCALHDGATPNRAAASVPRRRPPTTNREHHKSTRGRGVRGGERDFCRRSPK